VGAGKRMGSSPIKEDLYHDHLGMPRPPLSSGDKMKKKNKVLFILGWLVFLACLAVIMIIQSTDCIDHVSRNQDRWDKPNGYTQDLSSVKPSDKD
jgi:hypothetical protein